MKKGTVKDLYPQTFELIHDKINRIEETIRGLLYRSDEEEFFPKKDIEGVEELIAELVNYWLCFDIDFPKENLECPSQEGVIEDYLWIEHLILEIEEVCENLTFICSKIAMCTLYNWIAEIKSVLDK